MANNKLENLKSSLSNTMSSYERNRAQILKKAFDEGGDNVVSALEKEYQTMRDAYFELLRKELDANNHNYDELLDNTNLEAENLKNSVDNLASINQIIQNATNLISSIGRIIITLGI
jgi:hypothetical protein